MFEMKGDVIKIETKPKGQLIKFKKITVFKHVADDPNFECENYSEENNYNRCIEEEIVSKFNDLIGCHPPFISVKKEGSCNRTFNLTKQHETFKKIRNILLSIVDNFQSITCKQPCTKYVFESQLMYESIWDEYENGIKIVFSRDVELTKTSFLNSIPSFLTGIGGAISGG